MSTYRSIATTTQGRLDNVGPDMRVRRTLPSHEVRHVNPFVFLDHMLPTQIAPGQPPGGTGPHPHRGFITFTYLLSGSVRHYDSLGHTGLVGPGGGQWMRAASGIVHDEGPDGEFLAKGGLLHGFQFWLNLPAAQKSLPPAYQPLQADEVPEADLLPNGQARLRLLIGSFGGHTSPIPTYTPMLLAHIQLAPSATASVPITAGHRAFVYVPTGQLSIENQVVTSETLALLSESGETLRPHNPGTERQDVILATAQPLNEPLAMYGPFVMNDQAGIETAIRDYQAGKYGEIRR